MKSGFFMISLNVENHGLTWSIFDIDIKAQYSRQESFVLYLGLERCVILLLLEPGEITTVHRYQQQLINSSDALEEKSPFTVQGRCKEILLMTMLDHMLWKRLRAISLC